MERIHKEKETKKIKAQRKRDKRQTSGSRTVREQLEKKGVNPASLKGRRCMSESSGATFNITKSPGRDEKAKKVCNIN